jgi:CDP-diacylglycerol--glycerol-3-phosphate 3-phosphatidyltransferase
MNLPNILTLSRIPFLFVIAVLLAVPWNGSSTLAFVCFIVAAVTDWADGHFARRYQLVSNFGKLMDALTDKILIVGLFVSLTVLGVLPVWALYLVLLILCREFLITGLRLVAAASGVVLAAEKSGKQKTVSQMVALIFLLGAPMISQDLAAVTGADWSGLAMAIHWIGLGLFVFATVLTVSSGTRYLVKYWSVVFAGDQVT